MTLNFVLRMVAMFGFGSSVVQAFVNAVEGDWIRSAAFAGVAVAWLVAAQMFAEADRLRQRRVWRNDDS